MYSQQPYFLWLGWQAMQAIVAAFGQRDGTAVIKATNAYLNQLAASDRDKATALAAAINANQQSAIMCGFIYQYGEDFGDLWSAHLDMNFTTPIYPAAGVSNDDRMWLYRKGQPMTYYTISDILSHADYYWYLGGFGNLNAGLVGTDIRANGSPFTIVKFFVPTIMPTGYKYTRADGGAVHVNGVQITNVQRETSYDFSSIIELNKPNYVTVGCNGSRNWGTAMGFKFA